MPKRPKLAAAVISAAVLALGVTACGDDDSDDSGGGSDAWRIGLEAPISGDLETLGKGMLNGAELAADQINEDGGLLGKDVEIVPIDDGGDAAVGVPAAQAAIDDGLDGVVGPYNSGVGVETLPLYEQAGLVPIRLTSDTDTEGFGYTLQPMASQIAPVTAEALIDFVGAKTVAIAYDKTEEYNRGIAEEVRAALEARGAQVTAFEPLQPGQADYSGIVNKLSAGKPDAIYAAVYYPGGRRHRQVDHTGLESHLPARLWDLRQRLPGRGRRGGAATARLSECPPPAISRALRPTSPTSRTSSMRPPAPGAPTPTTR